MVSFLKIPTKVLYVFFFFFLRVHAVRYAQLMMILRVFSQQVSLHITKFIIMQISPSFYCFLYFRPKHMPQNPILKHPQPTSFP